MKQRQLLSGCVMCLTLLALVATHTTGLAQAYTLQHWVLDAAGGSGTSISYRNLSVVGQSSPLGAASAISYHNYPGFLHAVAAEGHLLPDYTVSVVFTGSGSGMVTSTPPGIQCNLNCSASFNAYMPVILAPDAYEYMRFTGWSGGGCTGTAPCSITLYGNTTVTATFDKDTDHAVYVPGSTPESGAYYTSLQTAYDAVTSGSSIRAWATVYPENLNCNQDKSVIIKGGYDQNYTAQTGLTVLDGVLTLGQGSAVIEQFSIK